MNNKLMIDIFRNALAIFMSMMLASSSAYAASTLKKVTLITGEMRNSQGVNLPLLKVYTNVFSAIEKDLNINIQLQQYPWNRAVMMASYEGELIFGLSSTPEREKIFSFSEPVFYTCVWLVTRADKEFDFHSISDLKGKTIGIVRGSQYGGEFDAQRNKLFKTDDDLDSYEIRLKKLIENRIDAMLFSSTLDDPLAVEQIVNKMDVSGNEGSRAKKIKFKVLPVILLKNDIRFAIRKNKDDGIIKKINQSLEKMNHAKK